MNRLVIIGNGFDLAHGLPTSYKHFIDDFWRDFKDKVKSEEYQKLVYTNDLYSEYYSDYGVINNFIDFKLAIKKSIEDNPKLDFVESRLIFYTSKFANRDKIFEFKNDFFKILNSKNSQNWVDIENIYYDILKSISKGSNKYGYKYGYSGDIIKLNEEFEVIKNILENYLSKKVLSKYDFWDLSNTKDFLKFKEIIKPISVKDNNRNLFKEFSRIDHSDIEEQFEREKKENLLSNLYILNFNYTSTVLKYLVDININENQEKIHIPIHGILNDKEENKINFGFGDEMDEDYKLIENINDNEYLRYFKSFQYLQNSYYKRLLDLIETEKFQVYIMGHSCGLSDRTLLNTIFEHNNCRSIKVYYHQKEDGSDNYTEMIQNISRHFNEKKLMREKIVNKTLCQPLPQIQLPKKV